MFSSALVGSLPYCCINFKRHKLYKNGNPKGNTNTKKIFKGWYYCTIEGCELNGTVTLDSSYSLIIYNSHTLLRHTKGMTNSFKSRHIKGDQRTALAKSVADMTYPSKLYHRRLAALDENYFQMGNLRNVPQSKNVVKQCSYEHRKSSRLDESTLVSLKELKSIYQKELKAKSVPGFIQYMSFDPLTVALWSEKDIELFHKMSQNHALLVDATGSVTIKLNDKEVFYFSFLSFDRSLKTEPVAHLEILTDRSTSNTLQMLLGVFLEDEMKRYGYTTNSVPILCITDVSWPIIKCLIGAFNKESLEDYICRSFRIASGEATSEDLPVNRPKTFVHLSLCHIMKAFAKRIGECLSKDKEFLKYSMSVLANAGNLKDIFDIFKNIFTVLMTQSASNCIDARNYLHEKMSRIEEFKSASVTEIFKAETKCNAIDKKNTDENNEFPKLPKKEDTYLQQCKRSVYHTKCATIVDEIKKKCKK